MPISNIFSFLFSLLFSNHLFYLYLILDCFEAQKSTNDMRPVGKLGVCSRLDSVRQKLPGTSFSKVFGPAHNSPVASPEVIAVRASGKPGVYSRPEKATMLLLEGALVEPWTRIIETSLPLPLGLKWKKI